MPYIDRPRRPSLDEALEPVLRKIAVGREKGDLTYLFYRMALAFLRQRGESYDSISEIKGILADTRDEIQDRKMRPREDKKIAENGDVL